MLLGLSVTYLATRPRYYLALATTLVKLYATVLMVLLNGRMKLGSAAHPATWSKAEVDLRDGSRSRRGTVSAGVHDMSAEAQSRSRSGRRARDSDLTAVERASPNRVEMVGEWEKEDRIGKVQSTASSTPGARSDIADNFVQSPPAVDQTPSERSPGDEVLRPDSPILP